MVRPASRAKESFRAVEEVVVSNDPVERQQKFQEPSAKSSRRKPKASAELKT